MPDAVPLFSSGAELNTVVVSGAMLIVMPMLITISPGRTLDPVARAFTREPENHVAGSSRPTARRSSGGRAPSRSTSPPDQREPSPMIAENGRNAAPAAVAL